MRIKIFLIVFLLAIAGLAYYAYPIIKNIYFEKYTDTINSIPVEEDNDQLNTEGEENEIVEQVENENAISKENQEALKQEGKIFQKVNKEDCDAECEGFSGDALEYCKEVCGLKPIPEIIFGCDGLEGIKKDYCLKDLAITKRDFKICEEIRDSNIQATCKNRIIEEIFNSQE